MTKSSLLTLLACVSLSSHAGLISNIPATQNPAQIEDFSGRTFGQAGSHTVKNYAAMNTEQRHALMMLLTRNGQFAGAMAIAADLTSSLSADVAVGALQAAAKIQQYDLDNAQKLLNALKPSNKEQRTLIALVWTLLDISRNNPKSALQHIQALETLDGAHPFGLNLKGVALLGIGDAAQAEKAFIRALQLEPKLVAAPINLGHGYLQNNQITKALEQFEKALLIEPGNCSALLGQSLSQQKLGRIGDAFLALSSCQDSNHVGVKVQQADLLQQTGQQAKAWELLKNLDQKYLTANGQFLAGKLALRFGQTDAATRYFQHANASNQEHYWLAISYLIKDEPASAKKIFAELTKQESTKAAALLGLAVCNLRAGQELTQESIKTLQTSPATEKIAQLLEAARLAKAGQIQSAEQAFRLSANAVQGLDFNNAPASAINEQLASINNLTLGVYFYLLELPSVAQHYWQSSSGFATDYFVGLYRFGEQDFSAAKTQFSASLNKAAGFISAQIMLAETHLRLGDTQAAEAAFAQALKTSQEPGLLLKAGLVAERNGDLALAEQRLVALVDKAPQNALALNQLAWFYASHNIKLDRGVKLAQQALALSPEDANLLDTLGWLYFGQQQYAQALSTLTKANSQAGGRNQSILYHLAMAHTRLGDHQKALQQAQHALSVQATGGYAAQLSDLVKQLKERGSKG